MMPKEPDLSNLSGRLRYAADVLEEAGSRYADNGVDHPELFMWNATGLRLEASQLDSA